MFSRVVVLVCLSAAVVGCGGDDGESSPDTEPGAETTEVVDDSPLPAECVAAPFTVSLVRTGAAPAGNATFGVVDAIAVPIPIVPDPNSELEFEDAMAAAAETDLLGYSLLFGDEPITNADSLFSGYEPETAGASRAFVSIFPATPTPIQVGDVITPGPADLGTFTTLNTIGMDLKAAADEFNSYRDSAVGSVTVLAITDTALCLDVDLEWTLGDGDGSLAIDGVITGRMGERSDLPLG